VSDNTCLALNIFDSPKTLITPCHNTQRDKIPATANVYLSHRSVRVHTRHDATVRRHTSIKNHSHSEQRVGGVSLWKRTAGPHSHWKWV